MPITQRKLLSVMFTDIVGYSALVNTDERRALRLLELHRKLLRRQAWLYGGRIVDTVGDGFLIIFENALAAVECAVAIQQGFSRRNAEVAAEERLRLRIGVHLGDVERKNRRVFGDGVNVAARVEPLSPHGGICVTAAVVSQIHGPLRACFISQGPKNLKNIAEAHEIFCLDETQLGAAAALLAPARPWSQALRQGTAAIAIGLAALALVGAWTMYRYLQPIGDDASIAVLPLENLSTEPGNADFVSGLHDSLLSEISKTPQLRVISRTSVMRYAHDAPSAPEIARALKVSYILEGSVQRAGRRVRINVQLIRAHADQHIWARTYDRDAADLFDVQSQIAREVARTAQSRVVMDATPAAARPTRSVEAYDFYLRAIALEDNDPRLGREPPAVQIALLEQAVALDPRFALAHAALARYNIWGANWAGYIEPAREPSYLEAAARSAATAMQLAPQLAESKVAAGLVAYWQHQDLETVAKDFEDALAARPNYSLALFWLGSVYDRMGQTERSGAALRTLNALDPYNERVYTLIALQQLNQRAYADLAQTYANWRAVSATPAFVDYWAALLQFYRTGNLEPCKALLQSPLKDGITEDDADMARWNIAMWEARFADAATLARSRAAEFMEGRSDNYTWASWTGLALAASGDRRAAAPYLEAVARYLRKVLNQPTPDADLRAELGHIEAALGEESNAINDAREGVRLTQPAPGAKPRPGYYEAVRLYAQVLARFGHAQEALSQLEWLLREPSGVHAHDVMRDPLWAPLNRDPAFRTLITKYLPPG